MTHDYKRTAPPTLFAALDVLDGRVIGQCMHAQAQRIRSSSACLNRITGRSAGLSMVHLIADNYATHKHPKVKAWLARHPRFHMHFTPTAMASWLNLVEALLRRDHPKAQRRGVFATPSSTCKWPSMTTSTSHNADPTLFVWTASASSIIEKVNRGKQTLESVH